MIWHYASNDATLSLLLLPPPLIPQERKLRKVAKVSLNNDNKGKQNEGRFVVCAPMKMQKSKTNR